MSLISTHLLEKNLEKVIILDSSWHMPNLNRNPHKEYIKEHIPNAIFFDIDKYSNKNTNLPHMLVDRNAWENIVSSLGINNKDKIVIYDNSDVISSCRCWYNFIYFGHNPNNVHVLDGGLKKWKIEKKKLTNSLNKIENSNYLAAENIKLVKNKNQIDENIINKKFDVIDARSKARFEGKEPEPRKDVRGGSIPNSFCLPFADIINEDRTFKDSKYILSKFNNIFGLNLPTNVVFSCGSGITAAVLALAYSLINNKYLPTIYDGSWTEYGKIK